MAYKIIRPRHGIKSLWNTYKSRIYKLGEMLVESPESGVGSGPVNIKFGDGVTDYEKLPYAVLAPVDVMEEGNMAPMTSNAGALLFQNVSDGKQRIASAITDMGIETDATATFAKMAENIRSIETGVDTSDATALASHITVGQTAYVNGVKITGTRPVPVTRQSGSDSRRIESAISVDVIINFNSAFDNAPKVSFSITKGIADSQHEVTAHGSYSIVSRDRTHFVVRIKNNDTLQGVTYSYSWTAEG